jgi:hypothetical protein
MSLQSVRLLAAAVTLTAAVSPGAVLVAGSAPAAAATCTSSSGVTVLVDFKQLGGGVQGTCVAGGAGQSPASLFPRAGFPVDYVQKEPGFVCRVSGLPGQDQEACVDTPPTSAYWGLWWSDGKSGTWSYSSYGVGALKVPNGGYVALAWKQGDGSATPPGVAPAAHAAASPTPAPSPSTAPPAGGGNGNGGNGGGGGGGSATPAQPSQVGTGTPSPSGAPSEVPSSAGESTAATQSETASASRTPKGSPSSSESAPAQPSTAGVSGPVVQEPSRPADLAASDGDSGGIPAVAGVGLIAALFAASAAVVLVRRRRAGT